MKLGFLTACLPSLELTAIADWAAAHDFQALEVATWPEVESRPFEASHIDVETLDSAKAEDTLSYLADRGLEISALAYYENNLHPDAGIREEIRSHLRKCVDAAVHLGCPYVGTFVGRDWNRSVAENVKLAEEILPPSSTTPASAASASSSRTARWRAGTPTATRATSPTPPSFGSGCSRSASTSTTTPRI